MIETHVVCFKCGSKLYWGVIEKAFICVSPSCSKCAERWRLNAKEPQREMDKKP